MPLLDHRHIDRMHDALSPAEARDSFETINGSLLDRARFLLPPDKLLIEMAFKNLLSHRQIGQIIGIPAGTVTRRLQRICRRLRDPMILMLIDESCPLPSDHRAVAIGRFLHGRSTVHLARLHHLSPSEVRRAIDYVRGWFRGVLQGRQH
jgi:DNA-directed RNA polymerase specialized sigma24 family protein